MYIQYIHTSRAHIVETIGHVRVPIGAGEVNRGNHGDLTTTRDELNEKEKEG